MPDITNIPAARSQFLTPTGEVDRVWYRFLLSLFNLTGGGTSDITLQDVQLGPDTLDLSSITQGLSDLSIVPASPPMSDNIGQLSIDPSAFASLSAKVDELGISPVNTGTSVTSLSGTAGQISVSASTGAVTISMPSSIAVTSDISTGGNLVSSTVGKGLRIKEGSNAKMGRAVLVGGTVTVSTTAVLSTSEIFLTTRIAGGALGSLSVGAVVNGTSFVINSTNALDTSTVCWLIVDPS